MALKHEAGETPGDLREVADSLDGLLWASKVWRVSRRAEMLLKATCADLRSRATELEEGTITPGEAAAEGQG